jgi:GMP synthase (glutamine-hydrolysing)
MHMKQQVILILDFGSQYTQLIARRVREMGVYCEIHPYNINQDVLNKINPCGIILSGGPATVTKSTTPRAPEWVFNLNLPILGICYGMQTMAEQLGGKVTVGTVAEFGHTQVNTVASSILLDGISDLNNSFDVWMSHGDHVSQLPPGFKTICNTQSIQIAAMADESRQWYGVQFHPEVTHTAFGFDILSRFVLIICAAPSTWNTEFIIEHTTQDIKTKVQQEGVLLGLSGGVDSSVVAALLHHAIGDKLVCVFVDTGLLRLNEAEQVIEMFRGVLHIKVIVVNAQQQFLEALHGVTCPEAKRKIIGRLFVEIFEHEAKKIPNLTWLAQGTIYPDVIESAAVNQNGTTEVIKSHHNVAGLPDTLSLKLLEPLRELFKDEVRKLGLKLGLPHAMVYRHPFPGPGLAVRILGEIKAEFIEIVRKADAIFIEELHKNDLYHNVSQAFAVFLPIKSVGVTGDQRRYDYVICLRAVETIDFMTAHWAHLPFDFLAHVSNRIINEVSGVSRVTYDISGKPPATIEWE